MSQQENTPYLSGEENWDSAKDSEKTQRFHYVLALAEAPAPWDLC